MEHKYTAQMPVLRRGRLSTAVGASPASWLLSTAGALTITTLFVLFVPELWHWMVLPTTLAGVLVGVDVVDWIRGRLDVLQPRAVVALFGLHLCYVGPLLHVAWDYWPRYVDPARDWRASLGVLALVNCAGLGVYRLILSVAEITLERKSSEIDLARFRGLSIAVILTGIVALVAVIVKFGGPSGYLRVISGSREALAGNGWLLLIAESWPLLLFTLVLVTRRAWFRTHLLALLILLLAFVAVQFFASGLRGSRGNTVWPVLIAVGLIHLVVRPLRRRALLAGALVLVAFMYVYGFYKSVGTGVFDLLGGQTTTSALATETGRTLPLLLLEDFGRAGTQSILVDRLERGGQLSWGMTYVGDIVKLTPDSLVPHPPVDKASAGTDLLYARGAYDAGVRSSRIYGLVGEGMLNLGLAGGALAFVPFAMFVRWADMVWRRAALSQNVALKLLAPGLTVLSVLALGSDLDNLIWLFCAQVVPLSIVVLMARASSAPLRRPR